MIARRRAALACCALLLASPAASTPLPRSAPDCPLRLGNRASSLQQFRGKVVYVDFWASWCVSCLASFPFMERMQQELGPKGVQVIGVNLDQKPADASRFLAAHHVSFPVALGGNEACAKQFGVSGMPSTFVVDRRGAVRVAHSGFTPGEGKTIRGLVERLLGIRFQP